MVCDRDKCMGSSMNIGPADAILTEEERIQQAEDFLHEYYGDGNNHEEPELCKEERLREVRNQLKNVDSYTLTEDELIWGARTAWRNAPRCSARIIWKKLTVLDCRNITDSDGMFTAICKHIDISLNGGAIEPCITIFRERKTGATDLRIWNNLLLAFAGYRQDDGSIIGDPANVEITEECLSLGWVGSGGQWDILPLVLSGNDGVPHWYEIPEKFCLTVDFKHPTIDAIPKMNLKWIGIPMVPNMWYPIYCGTFLRMVSRNGDC